MVLVVSEAWKDAFRKSNVEPRFRVIIDCGGGVVFEAVDGDSPGVAINDVGITQVSPLTHEIDPMVRNIQISAISVSCHDEWLRPHLVAGPLRGKKITVTLGERSLGQADFVSYFEGTIDGVLIEPGGSIITLECVDLFSFLRGKKVVGFWEGDHPLEVIEDLLTRSDVPAAQIDSISLDPGLVRNSDIGHFVVNRSVANIHYGDDRTVNTPSEAMLMINELLIMTNGSLVVNEDGVLTYKRFKDTDPTVSDWDDGVIDQFKQEVIDENIVNRVTFGFSGFPQEIEDQHTITVASPTNPLQMTSTTVKKTKLVDIFRLEDTASQAIYAHPDTGDPRVFESVLALPWVHSRCGILDETYDTATPVDLDPADTTVLVTTGNYISGMRGIFNLVSPIGEELSAARPGWFVARHELFRIEELVRDPDRLFYKAHQQFDPDTQTFSEIKIATDLKSTVVFRGQVGSTAISHEIPAELEGLCTDVTIPMIIGTELLERFRTGAFVVRLTTPLTEYDKQLLDFVTLDNRNFVAPGFDGIIAASGKWEIIGKNVDVYASPPRCEWVVMFIPGTATTLGFTNWAAHHRGSEWNSGFRENSNADTSQGYIASGLDITDGGGLNISVSAGAAATHMGQVHVQEPQTVELDALTDTYLYMSNGDGGIKAVGVPNANPVPARPLFGYTFLGKIVTGAATIGVITQNKTPGKNTVPISPFHGNRVQYNTVGSNAVDKNSAQTDGENLVRNFDFGSFSEEPDEFFGK